MRTGLTALAYVRAKGQDCHPSAPEYLPRSVDFPRCGVLKAFDLGLRWTTGALLLLFNFFSIVTPSLEVPNAKCQVYPQFWLSLALVNSEPPTTHPGLRIAAAWWPAGGTTRPSRGY